MKAYIYQADIYCADCGAEIARDTPVPAHADLDNESTWDSGDYPKGPFEVGEADHPQNCGQCGLFLENPLTDEGALWLEREVERYEPAESWEVVAERADEDGKPQLAEWVRYYFAWGQ